MKRAGSKAPRLAVVDGVRGLGALYVVLQHVFFVYSMNPADDSGLPLLLAHTLRLAGFGHSWISVFITVSGFCLMLPLATSQGSGLPGGTLRYLAARAWRILPPYYAALLVSLAALRVVPGLDRPLGGMWGGILPAFESGPLVSHVLLAHNLNPNWAFRINPPLWTVATEWQLYLLFPALLLPSWRRIGPYGTVAAGVGLGTAAGFLFGRRFYYACPWYMGVFAIGMAAAMICFSDSPRYRRLREQIPWRHVTAALSVVALFTAWYQRYHRALSDYSVTLDVLVGLATGSLLVLTIRCRGEARIVVGILEAPLAVGLGTMSYSLYLVHFPVLVSVYETAYQHKASPAECVLALLLIGVPLCLAVAYAFHLVIERPLLRRPRRRGASDGAPALADRARCPSRPRSPEAVREER